MKRQLLFLLFIILLVALAGRWYISQQHSSTVQISPSPVPTKAPTPTIDPRVSPVTSLPTKYITTVNWPPKMTTDNKSFSCSNAGVGTSLPVQMQKVQINNHIYCVTRASQGAAGSTYTQYTYSRANGKQTQMFTFTLRLVQCANYPEPEKTACEKERQSFNVDSFMDQYIQSNF